MEDINQLIHEERNAKALGTLMYHLKNKILFRAPTNQILKTMIPPKAQEEEEYLIKITN